jgi:pyrimidine operon attenuation protein/uracil phosphoribosyltransferase
MAERRELFTGAKLDLTLLRLVHQVLERYPRPSEVCFIGVQPRGVALADRLRKLLEAEVPDSPLRFGALDVTFFRDDVRHRDSPLLPNATDVPFWVENERVILIDDVLYTGRTVRAALDALLAFGRPRRVELLVLVDRQYKRHLPIRADFVGTTVHTTDTDTVVVEWAELHGQDSVRLQTV